ncbi:DUF1146 family protein [Pediococcus argentinicus]|uniref:DUF1146 family protein n=1 Tax=Pediococcus argentinicus TaxID=480391 RepID=UPI00070B9756|nr:DUF1146 family protein [Pediococcus argentinicus]NKZ23181.1 DUF1146 domain-containing protein [Pediococcus argentinicus]
MFCYNNKKRNGDVIVLGIQSLLTLVCYLFFIGISFWALQAVPFYKFMGNYPAQGKLLIVLLSVVIGYTSSTFFLDLITTIRNLIFLVK